MISDYYPVGMSECDRRGLSGACDQDCPVLLEGECPAEEELIDGWIATCWNAMGSPELEAGDEYVLREKPQGDLVTVNGKEFLVERFDIEPRMKEIS